MEIFYILIWVVIPQMCKIVKTFLTVHLRFLHLSKVYLYFKNETEKYP